MGNSGKVEFGWFIPTNGDGRYLGVKPEREPSPQYFVQVAQAAEKAGYEFALIPAGGDCWEGWIVGSWVAASTNKLKPLIAMRPGLITPGLAARLAATLDRMSGGRALINVVTGHYPEDLKATGDPLYGSHDERYERTKEFLEVVKGVWQTSAEAGGFHYAGKHYSMEGGVCKPDVVQQPHPPLYFGGSSVAGKRVAAELADVYLMWTEPVDWIKGQIAEMQTYLDELQETKGVERKLRYGIRAQIIVRETEEEAEEAAWQILSKADRELIRAREKQHANTDAVGQKRQIELFRAAKDRDYWIGPNLWSGLSAVRGGGGVSFVGTPDQVSDRIVEFVESGVTSFILSGYPHLEEAEISGKLFLPLVKQKLAAKGYSV
ncbi:LLM class flavin-dependent oxidoreductase [Paenibacillus thermoaerophilus]|uniref:LLM class flavin-dependent oxidoreductase n=1 Tax=Paenibacillus thermoaerophilus TaxID=1215385 RepID=A0ABW2V7L0_9BACL|nr:LLM class flavin-dependent oxidoreductase [Paenibacillus thermoaerophilus]TMV07291.1 LLM class flavin-dependent oxidoreductase [Paenibacillus thermoaerophilus]